MISKITLMI